MATNPNQADGGKQDGEAMVIVSNDAPVPDQADQDSQGKQDGEAMVGEVEEKAVEIVAGLDDGTTDEDEDEDEVSPIAFKPISGPRIKLVAAAGGGQPKAVRSGAVGQVLTSEQVTQAIKRYKGMLATAEKERNWKACVEYESSINKYETMLVEIAKKKKMRQKFSYSCTRTQQVTAVYTFIFIKCVCAYHMYHKIRYQVLSPEMQYVYWFYSKL
eukprot:SAG22_NODE_75_length_22256_cov_45.062960_5_plen_215_part_00